ncbi:PH domain-containing protein [Motilibacter deserti]|uniref:PH domain-containing protein n=1 Tax=Motilibacter deserti TaxID=2714956 RepID=A0ABX0H0D4_9ACTN|nr:PH domain-containing protein [Motilibacter deserti]
MDTRSADAFDPPGTSWLPVSPRLASVRRGLAAALIGVPAVAAAVLLAVFAALPWALVPLLGGAALLAWAWAVVGRQVAAWGYAERDDDLLLRNGVLFRKLVVVPYGRMQFVDVTAGPLDRAAGVARVQLHTASATTDASIPGLPPAEAARLRDRLAARGEARAAGL